MIWIPKQKLFKYTFSLPRYTEPIPTSSGVSDDRVNNTSPYSTTFCFSPSLIDTYWKSLSLMILLEYTFKYVMKGLPEPKSCADLPDNPEYEVPSFTKEVKTSWLYWAYKELFSPLIKDLKVCRSAISKKLLDNDRWTTYKIQDIAKIGRGRVISSVEIERQKHPLYPVYSSQTSNDGIMGYLDDYMFDGEYITWTTDGANAGTVFYRKGKFNCTNICGTLKIQPKYDCYFVSLVLQQATQKYVSFNLANPKLMNNIMASIKIKMPDIEMQKQLSKIFQTLDSCLLVHQRTCDMYSREKQYLLCQMFIWTSDEVNTPSDYSTN